MCTFKPNWTVCDSDVPFLCSQLLVQHGAPLFTENEDNLTPCDCADKNGNSDIALYLESKMVFSVSATVACFVKLLIKFFF